MPRIISNESEYVRDLQEISNPIEADILTNAANILTNNADITAVEIIANDKLSLSGGALTGPVTTTSTIAGVDISARNAILTTTTTTANNALPKTGGSLSGNFTMKPTGSSRNDLMFTLASYPTGPPTLTIQAVSWDSIILQSQVPKGFCFNRQDTAGGGTVFQVATTRIDLDLNSYLNGVAIATTSDLRIKNTIIDNTLGLDFVDSLRTVSFKYNDTYLKNSQVPISHSRPHLGFIAQEVEQAILDSGNTLSTVDIIGNDFLTDPTAEDMYTIRYNALLAPMVKAIQELSAQVSTLKTRIEVLESA
jgi:hypothetical protein